MRNGLHRQRQDKNGHIEQRRGNTVVRTLREEFGQDFLIEWPDNARLSTVREEADMSLTEMVRQYRRGKK